MKSSRPASTSLFSIAVIAASLGYFVDIYDLVLFNVVKKESLEAIMGVGHPDIKSTGIWLFNMQMMGMLAGGLMWGVWGDKRGRLSVMFGSILLYSAANIANAFCFNLETYAVIRVIAGIGLAGELGAGITLVSETMHKETRGYGTMLIVTFGALGAVLASQVNVYGDSLSHLVTNIFGGHVAKWQVAYLVGGILGLMLLLLRISSFESGMFEKLKNKNVKKGSLSMLFEKGRLGKYISCILVGIPIWFVIGVLVVWAEETFAKELSVQGKVINGSAVMYAYIGLSVGDFASGLLSQYLRSRKKVIYIYLVLTLLLMVYYLYFSTGISLSGYYFLCFLLGAATGYWAIFVTIASEQFGTNIRSTVTNTVPNFVRGSVWISTSGTLFFANNLGLGTLNGAFVMGLFSLVLAFLGTLYLKDTFGKDLDYLEE